MSTESVTPDRGRLSRLPIPALFALMGVGVVLALDYFVTLPDPVVAVTLFVGAVGLGVFVAAVWSNARATGVGFVRAAGRALWGSIRLVFDLF
jgi:hypothetical protein